MLKGVGVEDDAAADGFHRRVEAQDKAVAGLDSDLLLQAQLRVAAFAGAHAVAVEQDNLAQDVPRTVVEMQAGGIANLTIAVLQDGEVDVDHHGGVHRVRHSNDVALVEVGLFSPARLTATL